ncbi:MAG: methyltransferase domain-containing protein, partial [Planctomycetes bacterium]|nr:methyltransferase domain-containing protein [Planctomycetota bacterium]
MSPVGSLPSISPTTSPCSAVGSDELLRRYLNIYWLRPENAFWTVLRSLAWRRVAMTAPSLDLSCGDGVFSFVHAGGAFGLSFDLFQVVGNLDRVTDDNADMFDQATDAGYRPEVTSRPDWRLDVGTDWKATLLSKAAALDFYGRLIQHDNNKPLPFGDDEFQSVYCNSAKWVRNVEQFLREIARITRPDGTAVLHVKLDTIARYTLAPFRAQLGQRVLGILDRGRLATWPALASRSEWERRFRSAGLEIIEAMPLATRTHAHLWDIGLRPIAPMLVR